MPMLSLSWRPKTALDGGVGDPLGDLEAEAVEVVDVVGVGDDVGLLGVEPHGYEVEGVVVGVPDGLVEGEAVVEEELLVVGHLEVEVGPVDVLQVLGEEPGQQVAEVDGAGGAAAGVEADGLPPVVGVEPPVHVPVGEEHPPPELGVEVACVLLHPVPYALGDGARAELLYEPVVVDRPGDPPGGDDHLFLLFFIHVSTPRK